MSNFLFNRNGYLSEQSDATPEEIAQKFLQENAQKLGLTAADVQNAVITDQYTNERNGVSHIYFAQTLNGLEVHNGDLNLTIDQQGRVVSAGNRFGRALSQNFNTTTARLSAAQAVMTAAEAQGLSFNAALQMIENVGGTAQEVVFAGANVSRDNIPAKLMYEITEDGEAHLVWRTVINATNSEDWKEINIDATTGTVLSETNWTSHADYNVFAHPTEHPDDGDRSIVTDPHHTTASPFGWHDTNGVAGAEFTDTRGNNVFAQEDRDGNNTGGYRPDGGVDLNFDFDLDLTQEPINYQDAAITNLFYWNNTLHDILYQYGFDEASGNFQENNYGKGGIGGDPVQADAQDAFDLGARNNANFATPPDGSDPRMQMYVFNSTTPNRGSDLDNTIIIHEYGHGVSNRLTGGPSNASALSLNQSRSMGEGWSDFFALAFTMKPTDTAIGTYPLGTYVLGQDPQTGAGIRNYPYSTDMSVNPLTYESIETTNIPHGGGEIWAATLLDLFWNFVDQYGFDEDIYTGTSGNNIVIQLVVDAMKIQPANPTFLDARDAILIADQINNGGANNGLIWETFARRGMGVDAYDGGSAASLDVTNGFEVPATSAGAVEFDQELYEVGDTVQISLSDLDITGTSPSLEITTSEGDSEPVTLTESDIAFGLFSAEITTTDEPVATDDGFLQVKNGTTLTVTYNDADDGTGTPATVTDTAEVQELEDIFVADFSDAAGSPSNDGFTVDNTGATVAGLWHLSTGRGNQEGHSADDSMYYGQGESATGGGNYNVGDSAGRITSPTIDLTSHETAQLSFNYVLQTEGGAPTYDHARVLISQDGGAFTPITSNATELTDPATGWTKATVDLSEYAGSNIQVQFDFDTGDGALNSFEGWYVDDITVSVPVTEVPEIEEIFVADFSDAGGSPSNDGFTVDNTGATVAGLWHLSTGRGNEEGHSADDSMYYGQGEGPTGGGNYNVGDSAGRITSPTIDLTSHETAQLSFNYVLQTEGDAPIYDHARVLISQDGGAFTPIASNATELTDPATGWTNATFDLSEYAGSNIQVQFDFDTGDGIANAYEGWYIDDVTVSVPVTEGSGTGEIQGRKWHDIDGDGLQAAWEPGIADLTLYLDENANGQLDEGEISTTTDENGDYSFKYLEAGNHIVAEELPQGWEQTYPGMIKQQAAIEPDEYTAGTILNAVEPDVTISAIGSFASNNQVSAQTTPYTSTGTQAFSNGGSAWWSDGLREFRADFETPVSVVSLDFISDDTLDVGKLEAYDAQGNLLQTYLTSNLTTGDVEKMAIVRPQADISYILASGNGGEAGNLDNLKFIKHIPSTQTVNLEEGEVATDINFGNRQIGDGILEDFEDGSMSEYTEVGGTSGTSLSTAAAHDGNFGLLDSAAAGWTYRNDITLEQGDVISGWVKFANVADARAYWGFGASSAGTFSVVLAPNTNQFIIQENNNYSYTDLSAASQTFSANKWYRVELDWGEGGEMTAKLFDSDGITELNSVTGTSNLFTEGGIAFRGFGNNKYFDSISVKKADGSSFSFNELENSTTDPNFADPFPKSDAQITTNIDLLTGEPRTNTAEISNLENGAGVNGDVNGETVTNEFVLNHETAGFPISMPSPTLANDIVSSVRGSNAGLLQDSQSLLFTEDEKLFGSAEILSHQHSLLAA
jgi:hypothetical protein